MYHAAIATDAVIAAGARVTFDRASLLRVTDYLARHVVDKRVSIPVLANVLVDVQPDGTAYLSATDLDLFARVELRCAVDVPGAFTVGAVALRDAVKGSAKGAQVTVRHDVDAARVRVTSGRNAVALATLPVDNFPVMRAPVGGSRFTLPVDALAQLELVAPFASKEETRYYLQGVALEVAHLGAPRLAMIATDGLTLSASTVALPAGAESFAPVIVPSRAVAALLALPEPVVPSLSVQSDGKRLAFAMSGFEIIAKAIDGTFPDALPAMVAMFGAGASEPLLIPEIEPRLNAGHVAKFAKAADGGLSWECGDMVAVATSAAHPDWIGVVSLSREGDEVTAKGYDSGFDPAQGERAATYLRDLATRYGLPTFEATKLQRRGDYVRGLTCGEARADENEQEMMLAGFVPPAGSVLCTIHEMYNGDGEMTPGATEYAIHPDGRWQRFYRGTGVAQYEDGAYSIIMPRDAERICTAAARFSYQRDDGTWSDERALRTKNGREVELSADAIRALAGPVDASTHRRIPVGTWHKGALVAVDGVPTAAMPDGYVLQLAPDAKRAKAMRAKIASHRSVGDTAAVMAIAREFDPIRKLSYAELANPIPVAPIAVPTPVEAIAAPPAADYMLSPARYATGMIAVRIPGNGSGYKDRAERLIGDGLGCRYTNRGRHYVASPAQADRFERLYAAGFDANTFSGELSHDERSLRGLSWREADKLAKSWAVPSTAAEALTIADKPRIRVRCIVEPVAPTPIAEPAPAAPLSAEAEPASNVVPIAPWIGARAFHAQRDEAKAERLTAERAKRLRIVRRYLAMRAERVRTRAQHEANALIALRMVDKAQGQANRLSGQLNGLRFEADVAIMRAGQKRSRAVLSARAIAGRLHAERAAAVAYRDRAHAAESLVATLRAKPHHFGNAVRPDDVTMLSDRIAGLAAKLTAVDHDRERLARIVAGHAPLIDTLTDRALRAEQALRARASDVPLAIAA